MKTVFSEDFPGTQLDRNQWNVGTFKRSIGVLADDPQTLRVLNGNLELTMIYSPNYSSGGYTGDYVGAEISTKNTFQYGSFECRAKFAHENGSWPAFWVFGGDGVPCPYGYGNEIDIAELKCEDSSLSIDHVIHRYYPPENCNLSNSEQKDIYHYFGMSFDNNFHLFKCIWTPEKIEYYVDGSFTHSVINSGQEWFPSLFLSCILSQQIVDPLGAVVVSQTSYFDYVHIKQFFLAPEITCPSVICTTGTATMDVDTAAINVSWQLTPSSLFTSTSGTGNTANIVAANDVSGTGKITYTFQMPSGETFTAEKDFWVGAPVISDISGSTYTPNGQQATYYAEPNDALMGITDYNWILNPLNGNTVHDYGRIVDIDFYNSGSYQLVAQAKNACTGTGYGPYCVIDIDVYDPERLLISPIPTSGETTIEIKNTENEKADKIVEWDMEVFDQSQMLKAKVSKIKGSSTKIQTSGWKDGVYIVRAKIGDQVVTGKLVVKH